MFQGFARFRVQIWLNRHNSHLHLDDCISTRKLQYGITGAILRVCVWPGHRGDTSRSGNGRVIKRKRPAGEIDVLQLMPGIRRRCLRQTK